MKAVVILIASFILWQVQASTSHEPPSTTTIYTDGLLSVSFSDDSSIVIIDGDSEKDTEDWEDFTEEELKQCITESTERGIRCIELRNIFRDYAEDLIIAVCNIANSFTPRPILRLDHVYISDKAWRTLVAFQKLETIALKQCVFSDTIESASGATSLAMEIAPTVSVEMQESRRNYTLLIAGKTKGLPISERDLQTQMGEALGNAYRTELAYFTKLNNKIETSNLRSKKEGRSIQQSEVDLSNIKLVYTIQVKDIPQTLMSTVIAALRATIEKTRSFAIVNWLHFKNVIINENSVGELVEILPNITELEHFWITESTINPINARRVILSASSNESLKNIRFEVTGIPEQMAHALATAIQRQRSSIDVYINGVHNEAVPQPTAKTEQAIKRPRDKASPKNTKESEKANSQAAKRPKKKQKR